MSKTQKSSKIILISAIVILSLLFHPSKAGNQEIESLEFKSFEKLGGLSPANTFSGQNDKEIINLTFKLPDNWEDYWYIIHLYFFIEINGKEDYILLSADVNDLGCVFAEFFPFTDNSTLKMGIKYFNMIQGRQEYIIENSSARVYIANYIPKGGELPGDTIESIVVEGLKAGKNTLNISLTHARGVNNLTIFEELSGIECTAIAPPDIEIDPPITTGELEPGKTFTVTTRVWNKGDFPLKNVTVYIQYPSEKLTLLGNETKIIYELRNETTVSWRFRAKAEGNCKLVIIASASNDGVAVAEGNIPIRRATDGLTYFVGIIIVVAVAILMYSLINSRRSTNRNQIKLSSRKRR